MDNTRICFRYYRYVLSVFVLCINTDNTLRLQASDTKPTFTASRYSYYTGLHQVQYISTRSSVLVGNSVGSQRLPSIYGAPNQVASFVRRCNLITCTT